MAHAMLYKLEGSEDHLLQLNIDEGQEGGRLDPPQILVIMDTSSSMGHSPMLAEQGVGMACQEMGYALDHQIEEICFASGTTHNKPTVAQLLASCRQGSGCTYMRDVPRAIKTILNADPTKGFHIVMISDGQVFDKNEIVPTMTQLGRELGGRSGPITVALVRLLTDKHADPDTRALSCVGALNTQGNVPVNDIVSYRGDSERDSVKIQVMTTLTGHFGKTGRQTWDVLGNKPSFRRLPTDKYRKSLMVPAGTTFLLLKADELEGLTLELGGQPVEIIEMEEGLQSEDQIAELLSFLEQQVRLWAVMGTQKEMITKTMAWLRTLAGRLMAEGTETEDQSLKGRAARLRKIIHKREKSFINRILELENVDNMSQFNSQQQADFLRQATDNKRGKRLMRRAKGKDEDFEYDKLCRDSLAQLAEVEIDAELEAAAEDGMVSFYSHVNQADVITDAQELLKNLEDVLEVGTADDLLQLLGSVGVAFQGPVGDFPDPWRYFVKKVFSGCHLAQADLWMAHVQGQGTALTVPGQADQVVTGVDALASPCPQVFNIMAKKARPVLELQASLSMRRLKARVPQDELALKVAVTYCLLRQLAAKPSSADVQVLVWELQDLQMLVNRRYAGAFDQLAKDLHDEQPGAYLTGDRDISGANQVICALLAHEATADLVQDAEQRARVLRAVMALEIYHAVRGQLRSHGENWLVEAEKQLHHVLGINLAKDAVSIEEEVDDDQYPCQYDLNKVMQQVKPLVPKGYSPKALARVLAARQVSLGEDLRKPEAVTNLQGKLEALLAEYSSEQGLQTLFGVQMPMDLWVLGLVVQSLAAPDLHQRVDVARRQLKLPEMVTREALEAYLQATVATVFREDHQNRVRAQARALMENLAMRRAVERRLPAFTESLGSHTHGANLTRKMFWDTLEGALRSGDVGKVEAFINKSNHCLRQGHRFKRMVRQYGSAEMRTRWG